VSKKKKEYKWVYSPSPPKLESEEKEKLISRIKTEMSQKPKLSKKVSRMSMKSNRIYMYELVEQFNPEGTKYTKELIEGKYIEYPYARITLKTVDCVNCSLDVQRHNDQWMTLYEGNLTECINYMESDAAWF
jgi:hypothetical protein